MDLEINMFGSSCIIEEIPENTDLKDDESITLPNSVNSSPVPKLFRKNELYFIELLNSRVDSKVFTAFYENEKVAIYKIFSNTGYSKAKLLYDIEQNIKEKITDECHKQHILLHENYQEKNGIFKYKLGFFSMQEMMNFMKNKIMKFKLADITRIFLPLFEALEAIHERCKLGHFDISPKNFVCVDIEKACFAFIDFGSSQIFEDSAIEIQLFTEGTEKYMSEERKNKHNLKPLTEDLYGMGICLKDLTELLEEPDVKLLNKYIELCTSAASNPIQSLKEIKEGMSNINKVKTQFFDLKTIEYANLGEYLKLFPKIEKQFSLNHWEDCLSLTHEFFEKKSFKKKLIDKRIHFFAIVCEINISSFTSTSQEDLLLPKLNKLKEIWYPDSIYFVIYEIYKIKLKFKMNRKNLESLKIKANELKGWNFEESQNFMWVQYELLRLIFMLDRNNVYLEGEFLNQMVTYLERLKISSYSDSICYISLLRNINEVDEDSIYKIKGNLKTFIKNVKYKEAKEKIDSEKNKNPKSLSIWMRSLELEFFTAMILNKIDNSEEKNKIFISEIQKLLKEMEDEKRKDTVIRTYNFLLRVQASLFCSDFQKKIDKLTPEQKKKIWEKVHDIYSKIIQNIKKESVFFEDFIIFLRVNMILEKWDLVFDNIYEICKNDEFLLDSEYLIERMKFAFSKLDKEKGVKLNNINNEINQLKEGEKIIKKFQSNISELNLKELQENLKELQENLKQLSVYQTNNENDKTLITKERIEIHMSGQLENTVMRIKILETIKEKVGIYSKFEWNIKKEELNLLERFKSIKISSKSDFSRYFKNCSNIK